MTSHPVSALELSSYRDGSLDSSRRHLVEIHIESCPACMERLAEHAWFANALHSSALVPVPASVDESVAALLNSRRGHGRGSGIPRLLPPRQAIAAVGLATLLAVALLVGIPGREGAFGPTVASAFLYDDQGSPSIRVQFSGDVDRDMVTESLQIEPSVPVEISWQGGEMVVKPSQPLQPARQYTLSVNPAGKETSATPVALRFTGDPPGTPMALLGPATPSPAPILAAATAEETADDTADGAPLAAALHAQPAAVETGTPTPTETGTPAPADTVTVNPAETGTATLSASSSPSPAAPTATAESIPAPTQDPTPGPVQSEARASIELAHFLEDNPEAAERLGKAKGKEEVTDIVVQRFQNGLLVWRSDIDSTILLANGVDWQSFPDTSHTPASNLEETQPERLFARLLERSPDTQDSLGVTTAPAVQQSGAVQSYQHGSLVWISGGTILVLYDGGKWEEHQVAQVEEESTPVPISTATMVALSTSISILTETATPTGPTATAPTVASEQAPPAASPNQPGITPATLTSATAAEEGDRVKHRAAETSTAVPIATSVGTTIGG